MITPTMTVAEVLERHPETLEAFRRRGFGALANPFLRRTFAHLITIERACARHGVPLGPFLEELNAAVSCERPMPPGPYPACAGPPTPLPASEGASEPEGPVHASMNIGEVVSRFPETREVLTRFFGPGCFSCPAFGQEDVRLACEMHGVDAGLFVATCNQTVGAARGPDLEDLTINEILGRYPETARIFHRYGLDTCCGGAKALPEAAAAHSLDVRDLLAELRASMAPPAPHGGKTEAPPTFAV